MINISINDKPVKARENATILEASQEDIYAARQYDIKIASLNYLKGICERDDSGLCIVAVDGEKKLINASTTKVKEGMKIYTKTEEIVREQKKVLSKILEKHDLDCVSCLRTGNCELQQLQQQFRLTKDAEHMRIKEKDIDDYGIIVRDNNKCVKCGRCVAVCNKVQGIGAIQMQDKNRVVLKEGTTLDETGCVNCGQCIVVCPVGALRERDDCDAIYDAICDPQKYVVIQTAPSVRAGLGEYFGFPVGSETEGKMVAALKKIGFDKVFDTVLGADLTVMEETTEFLQRLQKKENLPIITSCCPGWVLYCEKNFPGFLKNLSTCKSPQQMVGAIIKSYFAEKQGIKKENIIVVSAMPCTAKKYEITREDEDGAGVPDVDYSITTRELGRLIEKSGIPFLELQNEPFDLPLGTGSGAGTIFGATGGVMEAVLRTASDWVEHKEISDIVYSQVRGVSGVKEAVYSLAGIEVKVAVVSGLENAHRLLKKIESGEVQYSCVEIMACPGGCVNGGGQPQQVSKIRFNEDLRKKRASALYHLDEKASCRKAHENPEIKELYSDYLEACGERSHKLLHTSYREK